MAAHRGFERIVNFSDAVVAIAITLLVLPLIEVVGAARERASEQGLDGVQESPFRFLFVEHHDQVLGLLLSFVIVAVLWREHHRFFSHLRGFTNGILWMNMLWLFAIAIIPLTTAITASFSADDQGLFAQQIGLYIGAMAMASIAQTAMAVVARRHPGIQHEDDPVNETTVSRNAIVAGLFLLALVVGATTPLGYFALFVQVLNGPADALIARLTHRDRRAARVR